MPFRRIVEGQHVSYESLNEMGLEAYPENQPWPLVVAVLDRDLERQKRTTAVLVSPFLYEDPKYGTQVLVPEKYVTDFASIPRAVRAFVSPFGRHAKAAVLHDWLYAVGQPGRRRYADFLFLRAMTELRVSPLKRWVMFIAVRLGGGGAYKRAEEEWQCSWADWHTGERESPSSLRQEWFANF